MTKKLKLSKKSKKFIEDLRVYLFSSGKKSNEIEEIIEELEVHLFEAEKNGKPIEKIIGNSPKEYMEMISAEMPIDYRTWIKYICLIIFGSFSFTIFPDLLKGNLSYSVLEIVGHIVIGAIFIASILIGLKYVSKRNQSYKKQVLILAAIVTLPNALFLGLIYLNRVIDTPVIHFDYIGSMIVGVLTALLIISISFWAKTWALIIILSLVILPDYLLSQTSLSPETQLVMSSIITFTSIAIYILLLSQLEKRKVKRATDNSF